VRRNERRRELVLSASRVNCWGGKSAADRQAPRAFQPRVGSRPGIRERKDRERGTSSLPFRRKFPQGRRWKIAYAIKRRKRQDFRQGRQGAEGIEAAVTEQAQPLGELPHAAAEQVGDFETGLAVGDPEHGGEAFVEALVGGQMAAA
jgi:hypothetical protein